jgi:predicted transcriptional regulator
MKSVLISIQPKWIKKIASGEKTIEVRKSRPKLEVPFKCYIYCTKGNPKFEQSAFTEEISNGKVIGEFVCDRIAGEGETIRGNTCLTVEELQNYSNGKDLYFWHITDLKIYDKPKELGEFWTIKCTNKRNGCMGCEVKPNCIKTITRPPQSWCYVEEVEE